MLLLIGEVKKKLFDVGPVPVVVKAFLIYLRAEFGYYLMIELGEFLIGSKHNFSFALLGNHEKVGSGVIMQNLFMCVTLCIKFTMYMHH